MYYTSSSYGKQSSEACKQKGMARGPTTEEVRLAGTICSHYTRMRKKYQMQLKELKKVLECCVAIRQVQRTKSKQHTNDIDVLVKGL